jgi:CubicO group peptidase (beta-lactamase class C family)
MDAALLEEAISFAKASESENPRDLGEYLTVRLTSEPHSQIIGPVKERGDMTGIILRHGYIVAEWGEPKRVDMTFSVTKSFLSTTVGLAYDLGLIRGVQDRVQEYMPLEHFNSEHNSKITWDHLLRQTSDWEGTLWDKPDWADRPGDDPTEWLTRERHEPGTVYKYNDVRVNLLALAALEVWRRPLPQVLKEYVMDPIGASNTWRWHGYQNSWVDIDGLMMQSVSGGGHWGGGMWISARDQARFGYFTLRGGKWKGEQLLNEEWFEMARTPTGARPTYGFMNFFLNTDGKLYPSTPENTFCHLGSGTNMVCVLPDQDLVVVARWIQGDAEDGFLKRVLASIKPAAATN